MTFLDYAKKLYAVSKFGLAFNKVDKHFQLYTVL